MHCFSDLTLQTLFFDYSLHQACQKGTFVEINEIDAKPLFSKNAQQCRKLELNMESLLFLDNVASSFPVCQCFDDFLA